MQNKLIIVYKGGDEEEKQAVLLKYICETLLKDVLEIKVTPYENRSNYDIYLFKAENEISITFRDANTTLDFPPKNSTMFLNNVKHMTQTKTFTYNDNYDKERLVNLLFPIGLYFKQFHNEQSKDILRFPDSQSIHTFFRDTPNPVQTLSKSKKIIFFYKTVDNDSEKDIRLKLYSWIDFLAYIEDIDYKKFYFYSDSDMPIPWSLRTLGSRGVTVQRHESNDLKTIESVIQKEKPITEKEKEHKFEKDIDFNTDQDSKEINIKPYLVPKNTLNELRVALEKEIIKYEIRTKLFDKDINKDKGEIIKFDNHTFVKKYDVNVLNNFKGITELDIETHKDILDRYIEANDMEGLLLYLKELLKNGADQTIWYPPRIKASKL